MRNLTINIFLLFCRGCTFSKVEEKERKEKEKKKTSSKLHHVCSGYTHQTTVKGKARRIKCCPKNANTSHTLITFFFNLIYSNVKFSLPKMLTKKNKKNP